MTRKELYKQVIDYFESSMPVAETELHYNDPWSLLVAVILSAQCTDKRVNMITPSLLKAYPDPYALSKASQNEIFSYISSCSYPNNKAKNLLGMANALVEKFNGAVPSEPDELVSLPGVGRKTANVIASVAFNKPFMAVDTHVFRVAARIGLTIKARTPLEAEKQLVRYFPLHLVRKAHHWLILHGRYVCRARKPSCESCGLTRLCKWYSKNIKVETT